MISCKGVFETGWPGQVHDLSVTNELGFIRMIAGEIAFYEVKARAMGQPLAVD